MPHIVTIALLGHLPSPDNLAGLRSRDQDVLPGSLRRFQDGLTAALPVLRALGPVFTTVYAPSTTRHASSARAVCELLGLPAPVVDPRLDNIDYGDFKGRPLHETPKRAHFLSTPYPGGTSWEHVAGRWRSFFADRIHRHDGEAILLAGQSGAAPIMLAHLCNGVPLLQALLDQHLNVPFLDAEDHPATTTTWIYRWD